MLKSDIVRQAQKAGAAILAFNIPYLPMMRPVIEAIVHQDSVAMVTVARLEWRKFESRSPAAVREEFERWKQPEHVWLHLDHIPIIDEDGLEVDAVPVIREAIALGYQSVMVDASRLPLEGNIRATRPVAEMAHAAGIPCEAELGAILGHEAGPLPPYEELFQSGRGFTDPEEARRFVQETGCDWLSVAAGNIHGAISGVRKDQKKVEARLNLERIEHIARITGIPLVLHGGSGIRQEYVREAVRRGIAKINIATEIRQAYEAAMRETGSEASAQQAVYERTTWLIRDYYGFSGLRSIIH